MNKDESKSLRKLSATHVLLICILWTSYSLYGAGLTIVTHGFEFSAIDHGHGWVEAMGDYIADRAGGTKYVYRLEITGGYPTTQTNPHGLGLGSFTCQYSGLPPIHQSDNSEVVIKLYWDSVANSFGGNVTTREIAEAALPALTDVPFAPFLTQKLDEVPIHLIGHSRGGSVMAEISRLLGQKGVWVHQLTTLDPHPTTTIGGFDDAAVNVYENVLFADNYYEDFWSTVPDGQSVAGASNRHLTNLTGGYGDGAGASEHSDVHLWYHGTVNTTQNASDGEQIITDSLRSVWYWPSESTGQFAGFYYSRLGGGGGNQQGFLFGYYNDGDFNNSPNNRQTLTVRSPNEWPNLITLTHDAASSVQAGNSFPLKYVFQSFDSSSVVLVYLDPDQNPYNGNEITLSFTPDPNPQSSTARGTRTIDTSGTVPSSTPPGSYYVKAMITNPYGTRYLYSLSKIQVLPITVAAPTISSISPSTLPPSASSQLLTIIGTNFKPSGDPSASKLVFYDPANNPTPLRTPTYVNSGQLTYNATLPVTGTWKVKVVNGSIESLPYSFKVESGTAQLSGLSINGPSSIAENGSGQFTATAYFTDGSSQTVTGSASWLENSSATTISSSGLLSAGNISSDTSVTVSASYTTGGVTKSASANVTVVNSGSCGTMQTNPIVNGSFETLPLGTGWTLSGAIASNNGGFARTGTYFLWFGGAVSFSDSGYQTITIPSAATAATLSYYVNINSAEGNTVAFDTFTNTIRNTSGTVLAIVGNWSNKDQTSPGSCCYSSKTFNLMPYAGQTIRIYFNSVNDSTATSNFRVDDLSVTVTMPNPVVPVLFGIGGPTNVAEGSTAQFNAIVVNCDGSIQSVTPTWSENSSATSISSSGLLTAGSVSSDTLVTVTGTYGSFPSVNRSITILNVVPTFSSLAISGPSSINENSSGQFMATAIFSDGSLQTAPSPSWSVISGPGSIANSGLLTVAEVSNDTTTTISVSATIGGVTRNASQQVTIINVPPPPTLVSISISGQSLVNENSAAQYSATAFYSDGSSQDINPTWSENSTIASISLYGLLSAGEVIGDTSVAVSASYTSGGITQNSQKNVIIVDTTQIGSLQVNIAPAGAVSAGAQWQVDGGVWQNSGTTASSLFVGSHTVAFKTVNGWTTPINQPVIITANQTTSTTGTYVVVTNNQPQLSSMTMSNGTFRFVLNGPVGSNYVIQVSSNLVSWSALSTNTIPAGGATNLIIPSTANKPRQFYRAVPVVGPIAGAVIAWGRNNVGQTNVPPGLTNMVSVAAGFQHNLALKADGTVTCWGENDEGQTNAPAGLNNVTALAAGWGTSLALKRDGTLEEWGWEGTNHGLAMITTAHSLTNIAAVSACWDCLMALTTNGIVTVWGYSRNGETNIPPGLSGVMAIAGGANHCLALKGDGTVVAWGAYSSGQTNVPAGLNNVTAIAAGGDHSLARKADGTVVAWGNNTSGETNVPVGLSNVTAISAGTSHSLALKADGTVIVWGDNSFGQTNSPANLTKVFSISAGGYHSLAITNR